jgi:Tle cognate immunity protein 4 C-terminal domain
MPNWDFGNTRRWCIGRFYLYLPESSGSIRQSQSVDGITLELKPLSANISLEALQAKRRTEILQKPESPIVKEYKWSHDSIGLLYIGDNSDPTYLMLEGRRLVGPNLLVAGTSGDSAKVGTMEKIVTEALGNFQPDQADDGSTPGFCLGNGVLRQAFRNAEEVHASFNLPQPGALLEIETVVVAVPGKVDLIERAKQAVALAKLDKVSIEFLRQGSKRVAGIEGLESVTAGTEKAYTGFDARFEAPGRPASPQQPELQIHLTAGKETGYHSGSMDNEKFLSLWDGLLSRISSHP